MSQSILIIGGGLIGCVCARALALAGGTVTVVDPRPGRGAGWAAGGMIAPAFETLAQEGVSAALEALAFESATLWRSFGPALGLELVERTTAYARTSDELVRLQALAKALSERGQANAVQAPMSRSEPIWALGALDLPTDFAIDPRALTVNLLKACLEAGVRFVPEAVTGLHPTRPAICLSNGDQIEADTIVIAAGERARAFASTVPETGAIAPIKGALTSFYAPGLLDGTVRAGGLYLIPRGDMVVVGATSEPGRADTAVDPGTIEHLLTAATKLMPRLKGLLPVASWAGVRPSTPDHAPLLGWTSRRGVYSATGWHRNGVMLAPVVASIVTTELIHGLDDVRARRVRPNRFDTNPTGHL